MASPVLGKAIHPLISTTTTSACTAIPHHHVQPYDKRRAHRHTCCTRTPYIRCTLSSMTTKRRCPGARTGSAVGWHGNESGTTPRSIVCAKHVREKWDCRSKAAKRVKQLPCNKQQSPQQASLNISRMSISTKFLANMHCSQRCTLISLTVHKPPHKKT